MASNIDERQLLTWFASCITALSSGCTTAGGTTTVNAMDNTSIANQIASDTTLTAAEKSLITAISTAIVAVLPSGAIHKVL